VEDVVGSGGPLLAILGFLVFPIVSSLTRLSHTLGACLSPPLAATLYVSLTATSSEDGVQITRVC
jgi:hypothetical protein